MTLIMPNTPFYRENEFNCGGLISPFIIPNFKEFYYSIPTAGLDGKRYFIMVTNTEFNNALLDYEIVDIFGENLIVKTIINEDNEFKVFTNFGDSFPYIDISPCNHQVILVKADIDNEGYPKNIEYIEDLGCLNVISENNSCKKFIEITYRLYCGYENPFIYYLKGQLNRQPAINDENISFLGTNGQPNMLFGITHLPMMLTTGVMGWREQQFLEQILNKNNFMINGNSVNKADGAIFTVRNSATRGLIGSILLIASTIVFNACCKDYTPAPQNYIIEGLDMKTNFVEYIFDTQYTTGKESAWTGDFGSGIDINFGLSHINIPPSEINAVSFNFANWLLYGEQLTLLIEQKINDSELPNKPTVFRDFYKLTFVYNETVTQTALNFHNASRINPTWDNYVKVNAYGEIIRNTNLNDLEINVYVNSGGLKLFVNINGVYQERTNEIFNETWKVINSTDIITTYQIRQNDGVTVVYEGNVSVF